jgi:monovalent cation/proton antiporter MnhG/PhaG subunit
MTAAQLAAQVLLWTGVASELICCLGLWFMRDVFDRLHFAAAGTSIGPLFIGVSAALTGTGSLSATVEAVTATAVLLLVSPLLTHATGRAARRLLHDDIGPKPEQLEAAS